MEPLAEWSPTSWPLDKARTAWLCAFGPKPFLVSASHRDGESPTRQRPAPKVVAPLLLVEPEPPLGRRRRGRWGTQGWHPRTWRKYSGRGCDRIGRHRGWWDLPGRSP